MDIIFSDLLIFSPQVKRSVIITNKHSIYELTHELTNDLRVKTQDPRKLGKISKISKLHRIITQCPVPRSQTQNSPILAEKC